MNEKISSRVIGTLILVLLVGACLFFCLTTGISSLEGILLWLHIGMALVFLVGSLLAKGLHLSRRLIFFALSVAITANIIFSQGWVGSWIFSIPVVIGLIFIFIIWKTIRNQP